MVNNFIKTFAIHTLGCKVNLYDSNIIRNELISYGLLEVDFSSKADLYIINTCSVTNNADLKSRNIINRAKKNNNHAIILVCGCYSQINQDIKNADIILGNKYKNNIIEILDNYIKNNNKLIKVDNLLLEKEFENTKSDIFKEHTRAFLKIQEGCNFMCSYCIIPFTRGRQRSKNFDLVLNEIKELVNNGYKEIVLTGVNTAGYCFENKNFLDLLKAINELSGNFRVRISSIEPFQINNEIINLIVNNQRFAQHLHICLQSGSDFVLKSMNRKYTTKKFKDIIDYIYSLNSLFCITTDYICGFPTETDEDHKKSLIFCKSINFYNMHIFPYSKRKFTPAATLQQVDDHIKKQRVNDFLELNKKIQIEFIKKFINKKVQVLFETETLKNKYIGKASEYFSVIVNSSTNLINQMHLVKITKVIGNIAIGELIK